MEESFFKKAHHTEFINNYVSECENLNGELYVALKDVLSRSIGFGHVKSFGCIAGELMVIFDASISDFEVIDEILEL